MENVFGERLKELRMKEGLTQKALAEKLEISAASIIAYEKGQKTPSIDVAAKIANGFGVTIDSMINAQYTGLQFKSHGDIARALYSLLQTGEFAVEIYEGSAYYTDAPVNYGRIKTMSAPPWDPHEPTCIDDFLIKYQKMAKLLWEQTLSQEIFDTWIESELSNLDAKPLPEYQQQNVEVGDTNAETQDNS